MHLKSINILKIYVLLYTMIFIWLFLHLVNHHMRHNGYVLLGIFDLTIVQNLHAHCATHEIHYVVECVRNLPLYMVCCSIENFGSPKLVTLGTIENKKTLYIYIIYEERLFVLFCFVLFVLMISIEPGCLRLRSWSLWKALDEEGCMGLVPPLWCKNS
jgi:hypothetical protein